jgi:hypothetical protein
MAGDCAPGKKRLTAVPCSQHSFTLRFTGPESLDAPPNVVLVQWKAPLRASPTKCVWQLRSTAGFRVVLAIYADRLYKWIWDIASKTGIICPVKIE